MTDFQSLSKSCGTFDAVKPVTLKCSAVKSLAF
jgi:hypothetical protein